MGRRAKEEEVSLEALKGKSLKFLNENFHKFKQATKIRVAIDVLKIAHKTDGGEGAPKGDTHYHLTFNSPKPTTPEEALEVNRIMKLVL